MIINNRAIWTIFLKELQRMREVWLQTLLGPVGSNLLFLAIFGVAIANRAPSFGDYEYLSVLVPGLMAMGLMMNSLQNPMSSLMVAKYTNNIDHLLMLPVRGFEAAIAYIAAGLVRGVLVGIATLVVGLLFAPVPFVHPLLILLFTVLLGGAFASLGLIIGVVSDGFDKSQIIPQFVLTPLIYFGGVFYSIDSLPDSISFLSKLNPIFYLVDGFRYGFLGLGEANLGLSIGISTGIFAFLFIIASWMFQTGYKLKN